MTTDDVGARIRHLRLAHGLTQRELAAPDYSRTLLAAVESGTRKPSDQMIAHLAVRFGMDQDDLRYGRPPGAVADLEDTLQQARKALSQGKVDHAEDVFRRVHQDATRYALPAPAGWAAYWLGEARLQRGDLRGAEQQFARVRADEHCPPVPRAAALARWAYCRFAGGDAFTATATLQEALRAARESGTPDPDARLRLSTVLLYLFVELDWRERAHDLEADIVGLLPQATRPEWLAHFYTTAGQLRRTPAELPEAERMFGEAGRIYRELGLTREIGLCHWAYGYVLPGWTGCRRRPASSARRPRSCWPSAPPRTTRARRWSWPRCAAARATGTRRSGSPRWRPGSAPSSSTWSAWPRPAGCSAWSR